MVVIFSLLTFRVLNIKISGKEQTIMSCMKKPELIGPLLGYCNHRAYQRMEQKLRRYGVTPIQCRSLTYLHRQPGPVTQKQLQQHLAVKPSTVNGIVDRLVEKGMLTRAPGETDARCRILRLTACGQQFYDDFVSITHEIETLVQRGMTPQEVDTLRRLLLRAAENLTSEEDNA